MKITNDWKPDLYLKYGNERTLPSIDLVNRISPDFIPERIIDIGCGPGNSSQVLVKKWPSAHLVGIDNSASMIEKAKTDYPGQEWILANATVYDTSLRFDIVFSNAAIQWIQDHEQLLARFYGLLSGRGILAVQIPLFWDMPVGKALLKVSANTRWKKDMDGVSDMFTLHDHSFYYDLLSAHYKTIEIWETSYIHNLESPDSILEMIKSTALMPYLERLKNESARDEFGEEMLKEIARDYPLQKDGKVLFPFKRLFFIGYK